MTLLRREALTKMVNSLRVDDDKPLPLTAAGILAARTIDQTEYSWDVKRAKRDIGSFQLEGAPAGVREYEVVGEQSQKLAATFESDTIPGSVLLNLRNPGDTELQQIAEDEVGRHMKENARHLNRQDEFMIAGALQGEIAMSLKVGAQTRTHTVDYLFDGDHQLTVGDNQLGSDVLATGWDDESAPVLDDLDAFIQKVIADSGYQLAHCWTSQEMMTKLVKNDIIRDYFRSTPAGQELVRTGNMGTIKGITFHAMNHVYQPVGGSVTRYIPKNRCIFTPEPDAAWGEMVNGASVIPGATDSDSLLRVRGRYAYSRTKYNPASAELFYGSARLPAIYIPGAILVVDAF